MTPTRLLGKIKRAAFYAIFILALGSCLRPLEKSPYSQYNRFFRDIKQPHFHYANDSVGLTGFFFYNNYRLLPQGFSWSENKDALRGLKKALRSPHGKSLFYAYSSKIFTTDCKKRQVSLNMSPDYPEFIFAVIYDQQDPYLQESLQKLYRPLQEKNRLKMYAPSYAPLHTPGYEVFDVLVRSGRFYIQFVDLIPRKAWEKISMLDSRKINFAKIFIEQIQRGTFSARDTTFFDNSFNVDSYFKPKGQALDYYTPLAVLQENCLPLPSPYNPSHWGGILYMFHRSLIHDLGSIRAYKLGVKSQPHKWAYFPLENRPLQDNLSEILAEAAKTRVIIVNEDHSDWRHRTFAETLLEPLKRLGYTILAPEAVNNDEVSVMGYPTAEDGVYQLEPQMGNMFRSALRLGYQILSYEDFYEGPDTVEIAKLPFYSKREYYQALNLKKILDTYPEAKVLVHVGHDHIRELSRVGIKIAMAEWLKNLTRIDPLTINQTALGDLNLPYRLKRKRREGYYFMSQKDLSRLFPEESYREDYYVWNNIQSSPLETDLGQPNYKKTSLRRLLDTYIPQQGGWKTLYIYVAKERNEMPDGAIPVYTEIFYHNPSHPEALPQKRFIEGIPIKSKSKLPTHLYLPSGKYVLVIGDYSAPNTFEKTFVVE